VRDVSFPDAYGVLRSSTRVPHLFLLGPCGDGRRSLLGAFLNVGVRLAERHQLAAPVFVRDEPPDSRARSQCKVRYAQYLACVGARFCGQQPDRVALPHTLIQQLKHMNQALLVWQGYASRERLLRFTRVAESDEMHRIDLADASALTDGREEIAVHLPELNTFLVVGAV